MRFFFAKDFCKLVILWGGFDFLSMLFCCYSQICGCGLEATLFFKLLDNEHPDMISGHGGNHWSYTLNTRVN